MLVVLKMKQKQQVFSVIIMFCLDHNFDLVVQRICHESSDARHCIILRFVKQSGVIAA